MRSYRLKILKAGFLLVALCSFTKINGQSLLNRQISITVNHQRLADVLSEIGHKGNFYFSYNGKLLPKDSLVTATFSNTPVITILQHLLHYKYAFGERKNYVIITMALPHLRMINADITNDKNSYSISGIVVNEHTGERLMNASVYEKQQLASTLTDEHGYFRLKFHSSDAGSIAVTLSKLQYQDTTIRFLQTVSITTRNVTQAYDHPADRGASIEGTSLARLFVSTRQMIQSMNIPDFFAHRPFQVSLTPGLSTHGMLSPQVVNKFSLNLLGGYTAGVNGLEIGGIFNINKRSTKYLQAAGIFNLVGGNVTGLQLAGVHNFAIDTVKGVQLSGFINKAEGQVSGMQLSILHNETHKLKGVQIGVVNVADTSHGASIGLINVIRNGFYKASLTTNGLTNTNISFKTGTHTFYSNLLAGAKISNDRKLYAVGFGIGHDLMLSNRVYVSAEADYQFANTGNWDDRWTQGKLLLNIQLSKNISVTGGPVYNYYFHSGSIHTRGYENVTNIPDYPDVSPQSYQHKSWLGWEAGLAFNSVFRKTEVKHTDPSHAWYLGLEANAGLPWDQPYTYVAGAGLFAQRDLGNNLSGILTVGYDYFAVNKNDVQTSNAPNPTYYTEVLSTPYHIIPVTVGIRSKLTNRFYIGGDLGEAWARKHDGFTIVSNSSIVDYVSAPPTIKSFTYAASFGLDLGSGLDAGFKFQDFIAFPGIKQFTFRLAYRIKVSK